MTITWLQAIASRRKAAIAADLPTPIRNCLTTCGNATIRRSATGSSTTGSGIGTAATTPATLGCWLRDNKKQVFLFTRDLAVDWTNNVSERGAKAAKRYQAVSGYWHSLATTSPRRWMTPIHGRL